MLLLMAGIVAYLVLKAKAPAVQTAPPVPQPQPQPQPVNSGGGGGSNIFQLGGWTSQDTKNATQIASVASDIIDTFWG